MMRLALLSFLVLAAPLPAAEPLLSSWFTTNSGQYARIRATTGATPTSTWTGQSLPAYADVQSISFSSANVYVTVSGLGSHVMGPWYANAARTAQFMNKPVNQNRTGRFPRTPAPATTKSNTGFGVIGLYVNGTGIYNMLDAFSWSNTTMTDGGMGGGGGVWNRDALIGEVVTFDPNNAHQPGNGDYHAHVNPLAIRSQLGDNVSYNAAGESYSESAANLHHSPIVGWAFDGYPIYGPYGYATANNPASGVRRLQSGYLKRTGQFGTTNLDATGRTSLPVWAQVSQNRTSLTATQYGPATNRANDAQGLSYAIGRYAEDWDFLGDLPAASTTGTAWDLDRYNGRQCVTPEFPAGTYAYFITINSNGTPAFPYVIGRQFYGTVTGGTGAISESTSAYFTGGKASPLTLQAPVIASGAADVTLTWSSVEGGTYVLSASNDLQTWSDLLPAINATGVTTQKIDAGGGTANVDRFYRVTRTSIANSSN